MRVAMLLFVICVSVCARGLTPSENEGMSIESRLQSLKSDLISERIRSVRVLFVPYEILTRTALTPELLRRSARVNRVVQMDNAMRIGLVEAIDKTKALPLLSPPDLRWGAIFCDSQEGELHSLYLNGKLLDGVGRQGIIDGSMVELNGALLDWFETTFGGLMERSPAP